MPTWTPWLALLGVMIGAIFGLVGVALGAGLTYWREYLVQSRQDRKDSAHLVALVAGALEQFSADCEAVAFDDGEPDERGYLRTKTKTPTFEREQLQVQWKALPPELMFAALDLPYRVAEAERIIDGASEHAAMPPDFEEFYEQRQYQYAILGVDAARLAMQLRQHAGFPPRPINPHWDSIKQLEMIKASTEARWEQRANQPALSPIPAGNATGA